MTQHIPSELMITLALSAFRKEIVKSGSAKLLELFDNTQLKIKAEFIPPSGANKVASGIWAAVLLIVFFIGPWVYGLIKILGN